MMTDCMLANMKSDLMGWCLVVSSYVSEAAKRGIVKAPKDFEIFFPIDRVAQELQFETKFLPIGLPKPKL